MHVALRFPRYINSRKTTKPNSCAKFSCEIFKMHIHTFTLLLFVSIAMCSFIVTTKVTTSYWRATFSSPPLNIQGSAFFVSFYALIDQIADDPDVKVVVFDSVQTRKLLAPFVIFSRHALLHVP